MSRLEVLVSGASIAGPMAAYWLAKAGCNVTVVERFPTLRPNGQNVDIRTCGVSVMRKIPGMEAAVRAKTMGIEGMSWVDGRGRPYGTIRPTGDPEKQSLISEFEILRGDLSRIIYDLTKDNKHVKYVFGEQIASMRQDAESNGVTVEFANGHPTAKFDLVAACDGSTSRTRAMGLGCGARDHIHPLNFWVALFSAPRELLQGSTDGQGYSIPGGRTIMLGTAPSGVTNVTLFGIHPKNDPEATRPFREAMKQGDEALKKYVAAHFSDMGWKAPEALRAMMHADDFYANEVVQVRVPSLSKGRFVMVGDAGYGPGPTGGGTSLAMTGGYVLAGEICKHRGDLDAALKGYEEVMRPLITDLQKIPTLIPTALGPQTSWGIWLRNAIFAVICWSRVIDIAHFFFAPSFSHSDRHKVPEYEWVE